MDPDDEPFRGRDIASSSTPIPIWLDVLDHLRSCPALKTIHIRPSTPEHQWSEEDRFAGILIGSYSNGHEELVHCRTFSRSKISRDFDHTISLPIKTGFFVGDD